MECRNFYRKVKNVLADFEKHLPEIYEVFATEKDSFNTEKEQTAIEKIYSQCTNISVDIGIMEKADNVFVIPATFGWSDEPGTVPGIIWKKIISEMLLPANTLW